MEKDIDIQNLLTEGEHMSLECKTATKSVPNSVWDTYSAFANTNGGIILLGVGEHMDETDRSKRFEIVGVEDADKIRKDIWNIANSKEKVSINLLEQDGVRIQTVEGKQVVVVNVPRAEYTQRPVYINNNFMRGSQMEGIIRNDDTLQHKAVREAVTNMVIHADLMMNGLLRIEKYDDRIVLTNPGLLKLPLEQIYSGGESKARNQRMQNMLRMIGFGENLGSGFPLILHAWDEKHWTKPQLIEQPELMQVKLVLQLNPRLGENTNKHPTSTDQVPIKYRPSTDQVPAKFHESSQIYRIIKAIGSNTLSVKDIMEGMKLKQRRNFMALYLMPAVNQGYVQFLYPNSPNHPRQKYLLTEKGKEILHTIK